MAAIALFVLVTGAITWKTATYKHDPGNYIKTHGGLLDYHRTIHAATSHFLEGGNPYGPEYNELDPANQGYPLFSPAMFLVYAPLGTLPFSEASWVFYSLNVVLTVVFAWLILTICRLPRGPEFLLFAAAVIISSRPGYNNLFLGQQAVVGAIGTLMALHYARSRPWVGAAGIFLTSLKPTFAIPLFIFLLCRRDFRCALHGLALSALGALAGMLIIAFNNGGVGAFVRTILDRYSGERPGVALPGTHFMHIDLADNLAKFIRLPGLLYLVPVVMIGLGAFLLLREKDSDDLARADGRAGTVILLLMLLSIYHAAYDLVLLALPFTAILFRTCPAWRDVSPTVRWMLAGLFAIPLGNHLVYNFETWFPRESIAWKLTTSINTVAMTAAFVFIAILMIQNRSAAATEETSPTTSR